MDLFKNVIRGLKFKYRADKFENPALQTLWRNIEATALNKGEPDEFIDLTIPSVENQNRKVAGYVDELKQMIFPPGYVMGATKKSAAKRKVCSPRDLFQGCLLFLFLFDFNCLETHGYECDYLTDIYYLNERDGLLFITIDVEVSVSERERGKQLD